MSSVTFIYPFSAQPTKEEAEGRRQSLVVDVTIDSNDSVTIQHFMGLPSLDPKVTITPLTPLADSIYRRTMFNLDVAFTDPDTLTVSNKATDEQGQPGGTATARVYIERL